MIMGELRFAACGFHLILGRTSVADGNLMIPSTGEPQRGSASLTDLDELPSEAIARQATANPDWVPGRAYAVINIDGPAVTSAAVCVPRRQAWWQCSSWDASTIARKVVRWALCWCLIGAHVRGGSRHVRDRGEFQWPHPRRQLWRRE